MLSKKKIRIMLAVIVIVMIALIGGNRMAIIKEVGQIREAIIQKFPSEEEKRRRIALWVVQHYDGKEPIRTIGVGKIYTSGIFGTGGKSVSVIINNDDKNIIDGILLKDDMIPSHPGAQFRNSDYVYTKQALPKTLDGVKVLHWREKIDDSEN